MSASVTAISRRAQAQAVENADEDARRSRKQWLLGICCLAQFMVILDVAIVNVALPSIRASLGFSTTHLQWIVNAYTITFAGFLMLSGRAADLFGQRRTFVTGLLVFALASLAGGTAGSQGTLVGARALQGLGGAIMAAASLAIITSSFSQGPERNRAIGLWGAMAGAGGAAGALLGGIITEGLGWRWILLINLPIGIGGALGAYAIVAERRGRVDWSSFDLGGALAITGGMLALVYGIVEAGSDGWGSLAALGPIALGVGLLALFVLIEGRLAAKPLVPLRVFRPSPVRTANGIVLLLSAALFPMWYFTTLYMQVVLHMPPLGAGLGFLPMALTIMACATRAGPLVGRFGVRAVLGAGLTLMALGMGLFAVLIEVNGSYGADVLLPALLMSTGIGFAVVPSTVAATAAAAPSEAGLASGLVNTSRQMGGALGLAILATIATEYTSHLLRSDYQAPLVALTNGFRLAYLVGGVFAALAAVATFTRIARAPTVPAAKVPAPAAAASVPTPATATEPPAANDSAAAPATRSAPVAANEAVPATAAGSAAPAPNEAVPMPPPARPVALSASEPAARESSITPSRATVSFSIGGERSWPVAPGSMTLARAAAGPPRRSA